MPAGTGLRPYRTRRNRGDRRGAPRRSVRSFSACTRRAAGVMRAGDIAGGAADGGHRQRHRRDRGRGRAGSSRRLFYCGNPRPPGAVSLSAAGIERRRRPREFDDIYRFPPVLGELDLHLLAEGNHFASYRKLGAHPLVHEGVEGVAFAVWAPNAHSVSVVGDFNAWDGRRMPMRRRGASGFWELFVPGLRPGHLYKYQILGPDGRLLPLKADPHAERAEKPPGTASIIAAPSRHVWQDGVWMAERWRRQRPRGADRDLRSPSRLLAPQARRERPVSDLSRACRRACPLCRRDGLHPYRDHADHGIPVRRLMGVSADLAVRTDQPLWCARRFPRPGRGLPQGRHRRAARLGARPFPERPARARPFRRHRALRACGSAPGLSPRLEHADLQLRPPRSRRIFCCRARCTGCANFTSTASASMPWPRCCISITAGPRASGSRTPLAGARISRRSPFCAGSTS